MKIQYEIPRPHHTNIEPHGSLADTPSQAALWYFLRCAHGAMKETPEQMTLVGVEDQMSDLNHLANSIAQAAGVGLDELFSRENVKRAQAEAGKIGLPFHVRVKAFIDSGGQLYAHYDRDPDSHERSNNADS